MKSAAFHLEYTYAYCPLYEFDEYILLGKWILLKKDQGYCVMMAINGIEICKEGNTKYREIISQGRKNTWIIITGSSEEYGSFVEFTGIVRRMKVEIKSPLELVISEYFKEKKYYSHKAGLN